MEHDWTKGKLPHEVINEAMSRDPLHSTVEKCVKKYKRSGILNEYDYVHLEAVKLNPANRLIKPHPTYLTRADACTTRSEPYGPHYYR